jgi:hypothetical protein
MDLFALLQYRNGLSLHGTKPVLLRRYQMLFIYLLKKMVKRTKYDPFFSPPDGLCYLLPAPMGSPEHIPATSPGKNFCRKQRCPPLAEQIL